MSPARAWATVLLLLVGVVLGVVVHAITDQGPKSNPFPSLQKTDEPAIAHDIAASIVADDARTLSTQLSADVLKQLGEALTPMADVRGVKFVGAVEDQGKVLSAYIATGKSSQGQPMIVGFVLQVKADQVVGVN
jgi:hypothetical protein